MNLSRRHLLTAVAALSMARPAMASQANGAEALLELVPDQVAAASLGAIWLKQDAGQPDTVINDLQEGLRHQGWTGEGDLNRLRNAMAAAVADDFRAGNVVTVNGWQMARAQAQLCALAYLKQSGRL